MRAHTAAHATTEPDSGIASLCQPPNFQFHLSRIRSLPFRTITWRTESGRVRDGQLGSIGHSLTTQRSDCMEGIFARPAVLRDGLPRIGDAAGMRQTLNRKCVKFREHKIWKLFELALHCTCILLATPLTRARTLFRLNGHDGRR